MWRFERGVRASFEERVLDTTIVTRQKGSMLVDMMRSAHCALNAEDAYHCGGLGPGGGLVRGTIVRA